MVWQVVWTPQRVAKMAYLAGRGFTTAEIAKELGSSSVSVRRAARRFGVSLRGHLGYRHVDMLLRAAHVVPLKQAAERRKVRLSILCARILTVAARDSMIDAILDDGKSSQ